MKNSSPPSLLGNALPQSAPDGSALAPRTLLDLMYDGFYALFLLKNRCAPKDEADFAAKMQRFLHDFERQAKKLNASADDIHAAKYAFCAAVDEIVLRSQFQIRTAWEARPLQLLMFGDQLAGENFFIRLDAMRQQGAAHVEALEVFHMCLLLGFQGKYIIEGPEKLNYLINQLGTDIAHMKGKPVGFAPHSARPDHVSNRLHTNLPLWAICSVLALIALAGYAGIHWQLTARTKDSIHGYNDIVRLAPKAAHITITLP